MKLSDLKNIDNIKNDKDEYVVWVACPKCHREYDLKLESINLERYQLCNCPIHNPMFVWGTYQKDMTVYPKEGP